MPSTHVTDQAGHSECVSGRLASCQGDRLAESSELPPCLADLLVTTARNHPDHGIHYLDSAGAGSFQSYARLLEDASRVLRGLRSLGLKRGNMAIFQFERSADFVTAFWACALGGVIPVPLSIPPAYDQPNSALGKLENAWALLKHPIILCGDSIAQGLNSFAAAQGLSGFRAAPFSTLIAQEPDRAWVSVDPDDLALLLLTSGSTGTPKGVMLSHRNLIGRSAATVQHNRFTAADISLNWMPLDHVGGIVMFHIRDVFAGCSQVQAPTEAILQQPLKWLDWIDAYRCTNTWAPNFAFGLVNDQAPFPESSCWDLACLRFILNGGEAIVAKTARTFLSLLAPFHLPPTAMHPSWGMSETSSGITFSDRFTLDLTSDEDTFVEVGAPIPNTEIRIVDGNGNIVPEGTIGSLQVRGIAVTRGYFQNPDLNASSFTPGGWFITGDLGFVRNGQLTISGRDKDVIIINGINFHSHEIESVVEDIEGVCVSFTAACAVRNPGEDTDLLAVFFHTSLAGNEKATLLRTIRAALVEKVGVNPDYLIPLPKEAIPKTAIGKIQRTQLRRQFESGAFAQAAADEAGGGRFLPDWIFQRIWRTAPLVGATEKLTGDCLILAPADFDTRVLGQHLAEMGCRPVFVETGTSYARTDALRFTINPRSRADYERMLAEIRASGLAPAIVLHLWTFEKTAPVTGVDKLLDAQKFGVLSLLHLTQALDAQCGEGGTVRIAVISRTLQTVQTDDRVDYVHGALPGLVRTLPQEFAWASVQHIDVGDSAPSDISNLVIEELLRTPVDLEVAYRNGARFVVGLDHIPETSAPATPLKHGGTYVLSGGLGGIGSLVAGTLLRKHAARVILLGRTPLPERTKWSREAITPGPVADRVSELQALEALGGDVRYVRCDVTDPAAVIAAVSKVLAEWKTSLDGVFHLAGLYAEKPLPCEDASHFLQILAPKMAGAWALNELVKDRPGMLTVHFSSVLSFFASYMSGAYSAANSFLDVFSQHQRASLSLASCNLLWGPWSGVGMSPANIDDATLQAKGYVALTTTQSLEALELSLDHHIPEAVIGLNPAHPAIRRYLPAASGTVTHASADEPVVPPATETERRLAVIWSRLLKRAEVGVTCDFFELGGRSLLAAQLFARIDKEFGKNLPLATLFKAPTLRKLAAILDKDSDAAWCRILPLHIAGSKPPFFCIPGGGSDSIVFTELSRHLGEDQPFYGLQSRGLDATDVSNDFPSVEETATLFVKKMRAVQPSGPYFLGGHCFGSLIAYEIARQLRAQGETIGLLALLDPIVSNTLSREILGMDRLRYHWKKFLQSGVREKLNYAVTRIRNFSRTLIVRNRIRGAYDQAEAMHSGYTLKPCAIPAALFLADDSFFSINPEKDPRLTWKTLIEGGVQEFVVPGDHHTMLHEPAVITLARDLRNTIDTKLAST